MTRVAAVFVLFLLPAVPLLAQAPPESFNVDTDWFSGLFFASLAPAVAMVIGLIVAILGLRLIIRIMSRLAGIDFFRR